MILVNLLFIRINYNFLNNSKFICFLFRLLLLVTQYRIWVWPTQLAALGSSVNLWRRMKLISVRNNFLFILEIHFFRPKKGKISCVSLCFQKENIITIVVNINKYFFCRRLRTLWGPCTRRRPPVHDVQRRPSYCSVRFTRLRYHGSSCRS